MSAQPMLPGVVADALARAQGVYAGTPHARAVTRGAIRRDAFDLMDAADLCAGARWVADAAALAEARGELVDLVLVAELRVLLAAVRERVARAREVFRG